MADVAARRRAGLITLAGLAAATAVAALLAPPIPQPDSYHLFADTRPIAGVANGWNVLSNVPFAIVGALGLVTVFRRRRAFELPNERWPFVALFLGVAATAAGSAYYHLAPDTARLFWDRLPMTLGFTSLLAAVLVERIGPRALRIFPVLVALGVASVVYARQSDDLRPYVIVQGFPLIALPVLLVLFPPRYSHGGAYFGVIGAYVAAKVFELLDAPIFLALGFVSGHTLKHLAAAVAIALLVRMLRRREPIPG